MVTHREPVRNKANFEKKNRMLLINRRRRKAEVDGRGQVGDDGWKGDKWLVMRLMTKGELKTETGQELRAAEKKRSKCTKTIPGKPQREVASLQKLGFKGNPSISRTDAEKKKQKKKNKANRRRQVI